MRVQSDIVSAGLANGPLSSFRFLYMCFETSTVEHVLEGLSNPAPSALNVAVARLAQLSVVFHAMFSTNIAGVSLLQWVPRRLTVSAEPGVVQALPQLGLMCRKAKKVDSDCRVAPHVPR